MQGKCKQKIVLNQIKKSFVNADMAKNGIDPVDTNITAEEKASERKKAQSS